MKKLLVIILACLLLFTFCACGSTTKEVSTEIETTVEPITGPIEINLAKYISPCKLSGANKFGYFTPENMFDKEQFLIDNIEKICFKNTACEKAYKVYYNFDGEPVEAVIDNIQLSADKSDNLQNGDKIVLKWVLDPTINKYFDIDIIASPATFTVSGLADVTITETEPEAEIPTVEVL